MADHQVRQLPSLARQNSVALALAFVAMELLVMVVFAGWVLLPLARRSADDLAGLMVLSAQTWAELPPQTRPAYELELFNHHALALRSDPPGAARDEWHPPYFYLLEEALAQRLPHVQHLSRETTDSGTWYWAQVPVGPGYLSVGLSDQRVNSQPIAAFVVALGLGLLLALLVAVWLARRLTRPLAALEAASADIGLGNLAQRLPETGPREMVALSRRFNAMAQQVQELLSARTTLLAGVSHDLRTPLARMRLALEMLRDAPDAMLIERMERDIEQMNRLIAGVLTLARGLAQEPVQTLDLIQFLQQMTADFANATQPIRLDCPVQRASVAASALQRALANLLQNARRYAPESALDLMAKVEGEALHIGVLDRGPGIAADQIEAMFAPFARLEGSRSPVTGGAGLGLSIVRELARANGWTVSLSPRPAGGLQAWIALPDAKPVLLAGS
jgi:two-component system osmolarity sensor histidine kinase EnvZ